ncbi:MAG: 4'-phosphopantetheinyl transferase superfamily protein [Lachnospiraceae bacterium]|nr:4'-phosphopantetheinyl transferase superfamily protein [Lachnospiraceae bacterium]
MEFAYVYYKIGIKDFSKRALHDEAYALLDKLLTDKLERTLSSYGEIKIMKSGKPFFEGEDVPYFNISHTKGGVMVGIASSEIGVDIEHARPMHGSLFARCFSANDLAFIDTINLNTAPLIPWTYKEAYLKALGTGIKGTAMLQGINLPLNHDAPDFSFDYFTDGDYVGSVYVDVKTDIEIMRI